MVAKISYYPVDNGDMTLVRFESGKILLIDCRIREKADNPDDATPDVAKMLKADLPRDSQNRPYVDGFLLSHPDQDHCDGLKKHFHLGPLADYPKGSDKIVIREMWSSPMVFRRASKNHVLCEDAKAFNAEARRRVAKFRASGGGVSDGDRILILGEDENGKTNDLGAILVKVDQIFNKICANSDVSWSARLLAPLPKGDDTEEAVLAKNHSSVIVRFNLSADGNVDACRFLTGGDAEVAIWEKLWGKHKTRRDWLSYDMLQTPHHCSWHSLSYDSWSDCDDPKVNSDARSALSQTRAKAIMIASSCPILDDDNDPPCYGAKQEYEDIADNADGQFLCVMEETDKKNPQPLVFEIGRDGVKQKGSGGAAAIATSMGYKPSSNPREVEKRGGGRYA